MKLKLASLDPGDYTVGLICALPLEMAATTAMLDELHEKPTRQDPRDKNNYILGRIGSHNAVIACLSDGVYGMTAATALIISMLSSYKAIRFGIMIGIGGGVPSAADDIRLGDVVVSKPRGTYSGVVQYDFGKAINGQIVPNASSDKPPKVLLTAMASLTASHIINGNNLSGHLSTMLANHPNMRKRFCYQGAENDRLYEADYNHVDNCSTCDKCDATRLVMRSARSTTGPEIFYGTIGSGNLVVKDGVTRDKLADQHNILCFEMEAAGLMDHFSCLVVRGICDYADSHKNKFWQEYAAATAAAYAKELLYTVPASDIEESIGMLPPYSISNINTDGAQRDPVETPILRASTSNTDPDSAQSSPIETPSPPSPAFILTNRFHLKESLSLASIIPDRRYPNQDAFRGDISLEEGSDFSISIDPNFSDFVDSRAKSDSTFKKAISKLFLTPSVKGVEGDIQVFSEESRVYMLLQPRALFKSLCSSESAKSWLGDICVGKKSVYFVVGYRTLLNARFVGKEIKSLRNRRLPPGIGEATRYNTSGERIYAICYRKVKFEHIGKGNGEALDSTNEWRVFSRHRGTGSEESQMIAADIDNEDATGSSSFGVISSNTGTELWAGI